jgi:hypothetical protein
MSLSLQQSRAVAALAELLYPFLPGKPHPYGNKRLSFPDVAQDLGLAEFWPRVGSKKPAIIELLTLTLERRAGQFCPLIVEVVRRGIAYRKDPVYRDELDAINAVLLDVGFKIGELYDARFLQGLPTRQAAPPAPEAPIDPPTLAALVSQLNGLMPLAGQERGYAFERFLNELFGAFQLAPRGSFRLVGEQIDGAFEFRGNTYLVEARWRDARAAEADLLVLQGKVEGKAMWSRGFFISWAGFTEEGLEAFRRGKRTSVICMDGLELWQVVDGRLDLRRVIEAKARRAAEENIAFAPIRNLFPTAT